MFLNGLKVTLKEWNTEGTSKWGTMKFKVEDVLLDEVQKDNVKVYQEDANSIIEVSCFILNNVAENVLLDASLGSICESVLSVIEETDIQVKGGYDTVNSAFEVASEYLDDGQTQSDYQTINSAFEGLDEEEDVIGFDEEELEEEEEMLVTDNIDEVDFYDDFDYDNIETFEEFEEDDEDYDSEDEDF